MTTTTTTTIKSLTRDMEPGYYMYNGVEFQLHSAPEFIAGRARYLYDVTINGDRLKMFPKGFYKRCGGSPVELGATQPVTAKEKVASASGKGAHRTISVKTATPEEAGQMVYNHLLKAANLISTWMEGMACQTEFDSLIADNLPVIKEAVISKRVTEQKAAARKAMKNTYRKRLKALQAYKENYSRKVGQAFMDGCTEYGQMLVIQQTNRFERVEALIQELRLLMD